MQQIRKSNRGQVTVEVAILFAFVVAALVAMALYLQRAAQGGIKSNSDSFGTQFSATKGWESHTKSLTQETSTAIQSAQNSSTCQDLSGAVVNCPATDPVIP